MSIFWVGQLDKVGFTTVSIALLPVTCSCCIGMRYNAFTSIAAVIEFWTLLSQSECLNESSQTQLLIGQV